MAYKDISKQREATAGRVRRYRDKQKGVTSEGVTSPERMLSRPNRMGANGSPEMVDNEYDANERLSDGRMRYLGPFSDKQVLDRVTVPPIDKTTAAYRVFSHCRMFTPNAEQLRENGIDLQALMKPSKRK